MTTPLTPEEAKEKRRAYQAAYFQANREKVKNRPILTSTEMALKCNRIKLKRLKRELAELQGKP